MKNVAISIAEDRFKTAVGMNAIRLRPHMTCQRSIGAAGFAVIENNQLIPANAFFVPGKLFEVRLIHSNYPGISTFPQ